MTISDALRDRGLTLPPLPMKWTRAVPAPNEPFELFSGILELRTPGRSYSGPGSVEFRWFPFQQVAFTLSLDPNDELELGPGELVLPHVSQPTDCYVSGVITAFNQDGRSAEAQGILTVPLVGGSLSTAAHVTFGIPNFAELIGGPVAEEHHGVLNIRLTRQVLHAPPWELMLEGVPEQQSILKTLDSRGGHAITHLGSVRHTDGAALTDEDTLGILEDFALFLSFAHGSSCSPMIAEGLTADGQVCWRHWSSVPVQPWKKVLSWFPFFAPGSFAALFPGFLQRLEQPGWRVAIQNAIHWYVSANTWAGGTPGAIILTQTALELLGWASENDPSLTPSPPPAVRRASDRIRRLLVWAGIPSHVPTELQDLAQAGRWDDAPHALTDVRNCIVHPEASKAILTTPEVQSQAWLLGLEYLELVLLRLFGYGGEYKSRVRPGRLLAEVHPVPWAGAGP